METLTFESIKLLLCHRNNQPSQRNFIFYLDENSKRTETVLSDFIIGTISKLNIKNFPTRIGILYRHEEHTTPLLIEIDDQNRDSVDSSAATLPGLEEYSDDDGANSTLSKSDASTQDLDRSISSILGEGDDGLIGPETPTNPELVIRIFNTDSRALDPDGSGLRLRTKLLCVVKRGFEENINIELYAIGLQNNAQDRINTIRQHRDGRCTVFSLIDLETMFSVKNIRSLFTEKKELKLEEFDKLVETDYFGHTRLHHIRLLPDEFMFYTQSVDGDSPEGLRRRGIRHFIDQKCRDELVSIKVEHQGVDGPYLPTSSQETPCEEQRYASDAKKLWSFIKQYTTEGKGQFDIAKLYEYIKNNHFSKNFTFDALCYMYETMLKEVGVVQKDQYNILQWSLDDLEELLNNDKNPKQKRGTSPLQDFTLFITSPKPGQSPFFASQAALPTQDKAENASFSNSQYPPLGFAP